MKQNYDAFIDRMISRYEGGYGWDRADAGGPTKYGITCWDLAAHIGRKMDSMAAWAPIVRAMTLETAREIYATKYAVADRFDDLASGSDCAMLDFGVNSGVVRPIQFAQRIYHLPQGTKFRNDLLELINNDTPNFINTLCDARMAYLRGLSNWQTFKGGWTTRVADLRAYSLHLAQGNIPPDVIPRPIVDSVAAIKSAQTKLNAWYKLDPPLEVDGFDGPLTKAQVRRFQHETALHIDGIVGPHTLAKFDELMPPPIVSTAVLEAYPVMARGAEPVLTDDEPT